MDELTIEAITEAAEKAKDYRLTGNGYCVVTEDGIVGIVRRDENGSLVDYGLKEYTREKCLNIQIN